MKDEKYYELLDLLHCVYGQANDSNPDVLSDEIHSLMKDKEKEWREWAATKGVKERRWEIWMEGYAATGEHGTAQLINNGERGRPGLIEAETFDEAIEKYMKLVPNHTIERYTETNFVDKKAYINRRANFHIWMCSLFDNEKDARKKFG